MRTRCRRLLAVAAPLAALAAAFAGGCGAPDDETLLRFLGFQAAGDSGTGSVSMIEGDVQDGTALKVDASFENQTISVDSSGGTGGITIYRVDVDYAMAGLDPPSFSYPVSLYAPPAAAKDATAGEKVVLSDIPIVPVSVKQWLIDHDAAGSDGIIEMTAKVDFQARTDAGEDLTVSGALAVTLTDTGGGGDPPAEPPVLTVQASIPNALESPKTNGQFKVFRTGDKTSGLSVNYQVTAGSDQAVSGATCATGVDYLTLGGIVAIASGAGSNTFQVEVCVDSLLEDPKPVTVTLSSGTGYTVGEPNSATVFIRDSN